MQSKTKKSHLILAVSAAAALAVGSMLAGIRPQGWGLWAATANSGMGGHPTAPIDPSLVSSAESLSAAFQAVHHSIKNAVVNINIIKTMQGPINRGIGPLNLPPGLQKMLPPGTFPLIPQQGQPSPAEKIYGTGSGLIISPKGYIVTNNHVVAGAQSIKVTLADGHVYKATVVGTDPKTDLAVVKINAHDLTYASFGNSHNMKVGDWVLAFGSPFGFKHTMTQGIISAKGRKNLDIIGAHNPQLQGLTYQDYIQTDAAINPGNSGGPLVNMKGHVIGINCAIATNTGSFNGIGFAIPSSEVKYIAGQLIKHGKVVRGYLGVSIADVRHEQIRKVAETFGFKGHHGVLVEQVDPSTPAAHAGLRRGDIIIAFDGKKIRSMNQLRDAVAMTHPGKKVTLGLFRRGKTLSVTFAVGTQPATLAQVEMGGGNIPGQTENSGSLGIGVTAVTHNLARSYHMAAPHGVLIKTVNPNGVAASVGIRPGDVILSVQGHRVNSPADFVKALHQVNLTKGIRLSLRSPNGVERFVFVQKSQ